MKTNPNAPAFPTVKDYAWAGLSKREYMALELAKEITKATASQMLTNGGSAEKVLEGLDASIRLGVLLADVLVAALSAEENKAE